MVIGREFKSVIAIETRFIAYALIITREGAALRVHTIRTTIPLLCFVRAAHVKCNPSTWRKKNEQTKRLAFECQGLAWSGADFVILLLGSFHPRLFVSLVEKRLDLGPNSLTKKFYRFSQHRAVMPKQGYISKSSVVTKQYLDVAFCLAVLLSRSYVLVMSQNNSIPF